MWRRKATRKGGLLNDFYFHNVGGTEGTDAKSTEGLARG